MLLTAIWLATPASSQPDVPPLAGRVVDRADILSPHVEDGLVRRLAAFEDSTSAQVVVLTISSLRGENLEEYATTVFRTWGLGQAESDNGVLLLIARDDRELRIEVGYGLEGELTDAAAGRIIRNVIVPRFKRGGFDAGVLEGVEAILGTLEGTYAPPEDASDPEVDLFALVLLVGLPLYSLARALYHGLGDPSHDLAFLIFGIVVGGLLGLGVTLALGPGWWIALIAAVPIVAVAANRYIRSHPRLGPARQQRRRRARIIASARRAGKSSVVIDGVSYPVPSGSSGGGFSGGGGSSGGGGASGSW